MTTIIIKRMVASAGAMSLLATGTAFASPYSSLGLSSGVSASMSASVNTDKGTLKEMKEDWKNSIKDFRVRARMMRKDLKENGRSDRKNYVKVNANVDVACAKTEITQRETALLSALETYYTSWKAALQKRQASLEAAWSITVETDRAVAIKAAWNVYMSDMKAARKAFHDAKELAWKSFNADVKANCKATAAIDAGGESVDDDDHDENDND